MFNYWEVFLEIRVLFSLFLFSLMCWAVERLQQMALTWGWWNSSIKTDALELIEQHGWIRLLPLHSYSTTTSCHLSMDRSAFVGAVGFSTIHQRIQVSCPHVHWVIGIQTSVLAVDLIVAHKPAPAPLGCGLEAPGKHHLRSSPWWKSLCESPVFQQRRSNTSLEQKNMMHWRRLEK